MYNVWANDRFMIDRVLVTPMSARTENFLKHSGLGLDSLSVSRDTEHGADWDKGGIYENAVVSCGEDHVSAYVLHYSRQEW